MSRSKAELIELGKKYGINNGEDIPYGQLEKQIADLKAQANPKPVKPASKNQARKKGRRKPTVSSSPSSSLRTARVAAGVKKGDAVSGRGQAGPEKSKQSGRVELRKGLVRYYYVIKAANGEITSTSQKYFSKYNARRAGVAVSREQDLTYVERTF